MENHAKQLFADVEDALIQRGEAPAVVIAYRWARFQWLRDELHLLASSRYRPRAIARFGYRLLKLGARKTASKVRRRLLRSR